MTREGKYEVGYGRPPAQSRFTKGKSGNPKGRPKKCAPKKPAQANTSTLGLLANKLLIEEAYRPVTIREGEKVIELPTIQAVHRATAVSALKGDRFARRALVEQVQQVEATKAEERLELIKTLIEYKEYWTRIIAEARRTGRAEPQPVPHPDDIFIDFGSGDYQICGPMTDDEKRDWDRRTNRRDEAQAEVSYYAKAYRRARSEDKKAFWLCEWHREQTVFDLINDNLPCRYQKELEDRSYEDGASEPGSQKHVIGSDR
jgi:hypothetical protein